MDFQRFLFVFFHHKENASHAPDQNQKCTTKKIESSTNGVHITKVGSQSNTPVKSGFEVTSKGPDFPKRGAKKPTDFVEKLHTADHVAESDGIKVSGTTESKDISKGAQPTIKQKVTPLQTDSFSTTPGKGAKIQVNYQVNYVLAFAANKVESFQLQVNKPNSN